MAKEISKPVAAGIIGLSVVLVSGLGWFLLRKSEQPRKPVQQVQLSNMGDMSAKMPKGLAIAPQRQGGGKGVAAPSMTPALMAKMQASGMMPGQMSGAGGMTQGGPPRFSRPPSRPGGMRTMGGMNGMPPGGPGGPGGPMPGSMNPGQPMPGGMPPTDEVSASEASRKRDPSKPVGMPDLPKDVVIKKVDPPGSSSAGHKQ